MSRLRIFVLGVACLVAATTLAGCFHGGDGGGGEDPQKILADTFSGAHKVDSGTLDLSIDASGKGAGQSGSLSASLAGPFQSLGKDKLPAFDITAKANAEGGGQSFDFAGGLTSTGDAGFVSYQGTDYEVPEQIFSQFAQGFQQAQSQAQDSGTVGPTGAECLKQGGINPQDWLTNLSNEGDQDVGGTTAIHISGDLDVARLVSDVPKIADACGAGQIPSGSLDTSQLGQVTDAVKEAKFDIYSGKDDNTLRKLDAQVTIEPSAGTAQGLENLTLSFSLALSNVNEKQTISAPSGAKPLEELLKQLGVPPEVLSGGLGGLGGISGLGGLGGTGSTPPTPTVPPSSGGGGGSTGGGSANSQKYLDCLQKAESSAELQACSALLQ